MTRWRTQALLLAASSLIVFGCARADQSEVGPPRQKLLLLTSLPLLFGEQFSLDGGGSPVLSALRQRYEVVPISVSSSEELAKGKVLLMAHPLAQTPENLVALDAWVRRGGRVLLLADPMLEWPSERPLGDALRPPPMFIDTGLLKHWGLRLDAPDEHGPQPRQLAGQRVMTASPGALSGSCEVSSDRLVAHCMIGKGRGTVIADADILNSNQLGDAADHNVDAVIAELARLSSK